MHAHGQMAGTTSLCKDHDAQIQAKANARKKVHFPCMHARGLTTMRDSCHAQAPPTDLNRPVQLTKGLYVCGDHRDNATLDGALRSGRRAAEAILAAPAPGARARQPVAAEA